MIIKAPGTEGWISFSFFLIMWLELFCRMPLSGIDGVVKGEGLEVDECGGNVMEGNARNCVEQ